jgi:hypothetical protein
MLSYEQVQLFANFCMSQQVFQCEDEKCGHFYHPKCLARLLYPDSSMQPLNFEEEVARGLKFLCPVHKCHVCKGGENKNDMENQFAVCRRCPTVYHRKCLPRFDFTLERCLCHLPNILLLKHGSSFLLLTLCTCFAVT